MKSLRAHVEHGRVVIDDEVDLPDGTRLQLVLTDDGTDDLDDEQRARLHDALANAWRSIEAGRFVPVEDVLAELRSRGCPPP